MDVHFLFKKTVFSMQRQEYSFVCHSIILLLESEKNVLPVSKADTDLTFQQEQASWGSLHSFLWILFSFHFNNL